MIRVSLLAALAIVLTQSGFARGLLGLSEDQELADVRKMQGVEVRTVEFKNGEKLLVRFDFEILHKNKLLGQGRFRELRLHTIERMTPEERKQLPPDWVDTSSMLRLWGAVLLIRDKAERIMCEIPIQVDRDVSTEEKMNFTRISFTIAEEFVEKSYFQLGENNGWFNQETNVYLGRKPNNPQPEKAPKNANPQSDPTPPDPGDEKEIPSVK